MTSPDDGVDPLAAIEATQRLIDAINERVAEIAGAPPGPPSEALRSAVDHLAVSIPTFTTLVERRHAAAGDAFAHAVALEDRQRSAAALLADQAVRLDLLMRTVRALERMLVLRDGALSRGWIA